MEKKTKIIIAVIVVLVILLLILLVSWLLKRNDDLSQKYNFLTEHKVITTISELESLDKNKPVAVLFHAPDCAGCLSFKPAFEQLVKDYSKDYNFVALNIREPQNYPLMQGNVGSIPTITIFDTEIGNKIHISLSSIRSYGELKAEFERYKNIRSFIDMEKAKKAHQLKLQEYQKEIKKLSKR